MEIKCSPDCMFFPRNIYDNLNYFIDENGIKHSNIKPICNFDDHLITNWVMCENFKSYKASNKKLIVFVGASASGKDTALTYLIVNHDFRPIVSHTTRPKREGEREGREYHFVTNKEFKKLIKSKEIIEYRSYETLVNNKKAKWYYGTSKNEFKPYKKLVCVVDLDGLKSLGEYLGRENLIAIYIKSDSQIRKHRAEKRGSFDEYEWERRIKDDNKKFTKTIIEKLVDYTVINNSTKREFFRQINEIIAKENLV